MEKDKEIVTNLREARKFVFDTMKKVRDTDMEVSRAKAVNMCAKEMVALGRLELEVEGILK